MTDNPAMVGGKPDTWHVLTMADAYQPRPPSKYVVEGLFKLPSLNIVYSHPGALKSMWLAYLAVCIASGQRALSPLQSENFASLATIQVPVLWLDFDNGKDRTLERFAAIGKALKVPADIPLYMYSLPSPCLNIGDDRSVDNLLERIHRYGAKFVVGDNLGTISGGIDENTSAMIKPMFNLRRLVEESEACMSVIHHQRKNTGNKNARDGESLRGHSSIDSALDLALLIEREERSADITIKSTKTRGKDVYPFGCHFAYEHDDRGELDKVLFLGYPIEDTQSDKAICDVILSVIAKSGPINQTQLYKAVKEVLPTIGENRIRRIANVMVATSQLVSYTGKSNSVMYNLPGQRPSFKVGG